MALRKTHIVVSELVITTGIYIWQPVVPIEIVGLIGGWIGAQLPDADLSNTQANHWFGPFGKIISLMKHRTWTHSLLAVIFLLLLSMFIPVSQLLNANNNNINYERLLFLMITAGFFLHLVEDSFSNHGVPWLYPFYNTKNNGRHARPAFRFYYRTGGTFEKVVYILSYIGLCIMLFLFFQKAYLV